MPQTNNTKQAAWVAIGSLCSFGFAIVSSMILSRYFNKADYGTYKQVMYVYSTLLTVFTLGLPKAFSYFLPRVELCQAKSLIRKITNLFFILGGVFSVLLFVFSPQIADILKNPDLAKALKVFAIVPLLMLPTMGLEGILATFKQTKFIALYHIATNIFKLLCVALPVMIWDLSYIEAIVGFVVASFITFLLALYLKNYPVKNSGNAKCSVSMKEILRFSLPLMYASLWGLLMNSCDQFFISRYFGTEVFADFTNGSMELPFIGMIVGACSTILSPIFSRMSHEEVDLNQAAYPIWKSVYKKTASLIYPIIVYCFVFADAIMVVLYGSKYETSHIYFRIKVLTYIFSLIIFAPFLINTGKVKFYARVTAIFAILIWPLEYLGVLLTDSPYSISVISLVMHVAKVFVLLYEIAKMFKVKLFELFPLKLIGKIIIPSIIILYAIKLCLSICNVQTPIVLLLISLIAYGLIYLVYCKIAKLDYLSIIKPLISK